MLDLLVLDAGNPRALAYQVALLGEAVSTPCPTPHGAASPASPDEPAERLVLETPPRSASPTPHALAAGGPDGRRSDLLAVLDRLPRGHVAGARRDRRALHRRSSRSARSLAPASRSISTRRCSCDLRGHAPHRVRVRGARVGQLRAGPPAASRTARAVVPTRAVTSIRCPTTTASTSTTSATGRSNFSILAAAHVAHGHRRRAPSRSTSRRRRRCSPTSRGSWSAGASPARRARPRSPPASSCSTRRGSRPRRRRWPSSPRRRSPPAARSARRSPTCRTASTTEFEYEPGATTVTLDRSRSCWPAARACARTSPTWRSAACAASGLAARYVSRLPGDRSRRRASERLPGADQSHAWASLYVPGDGWIDVDPTNDRFVNDRYVTTAWGRDYGDVPPDRGRHLHRRQRARAHGHGRRHPPRRLNRAVQSHHDATMRPCVPRWCSTTRCTNRRDVPRSRNVGRSATSCPRGPGAVASWSSAPLPYEHSASSTVRS